MGTVWEIIKNLAKLRQLIDLIKALIGFFKKPK